MGFVACGGAEACDADGEERDVGAVGEEPEEDEADDFFEVSLDLLRDS